MAERGHWVPMVCAGSLQCLQGALGFQELIFFSSLGFEALILFSVLWKNCSPSSWDSCSWRVRSCWCPFHIDQHQLGDMKHENAFLKAVFPKLWNLMCFLGCCLWDSEKLLAWTCVCAASWADCSSKFVREATADAAGLRFGGLLLLLVLSR